MRWKEAALLGGMALGLLVWHARLVQLWTRLDRQPPAWDAAVHLSTAQDYREAWRDGRWLDAILTQPRPGRPAYPPFYHYTLIPVLCAQAPQRAVAWLNLAYLMIFILAAGWIAWELGGLWPAAATLCAVGFAPGILPLFREAFTDVAVAAWVSLAYALLLRSRLYRSAVVSWGVGLCAGLALDSRWSAAIFLVPAWCAGLPQRECRRNLWRATAAAAIVAGPWYLLNGVLMLPSLWTAAMVGYAGLPPTWSWGNWWFYPSFWVRCFSGVGGLLLLAGAIWALARGCAGVGLRPRGWQAWWSQPALPPDLVAAGRGWVAAGLVFSYVVLTLVPTKDPRYILPGTAAVPALGAAGLPAPALAAVAASVLWQGRSAVAPKPGDWHAQDILGEVEARRDKARPVASLCLLANQPGINSDTYGWLLRHQGLSHITIGCEQSQIPEWADFVLAKSGSAGSFMSESTLAIARDALGGAGLFPRAFQEARRWPLPDGSQAVLFAARRDLPVLTGTRRWPSLPVKSARLEDVRLAWRGGASYEVSIATLTLSKLAAPVRGVRLRLDGARLLEQDGRVYILALGTVTLESARWRFDEISQALSRRSGLPVALGEEQGALSARLGRGLLSAEAALRLDREGDSLVVRLRRARLLGLPVPGAGRFSWRRGLAPRGPYQPYAIELKPVRLDARELRVGD